jgi:hypothetical protein
MKDVAAIFNAEIWDIRENADDEFTIIKTFTSWDELVTYCKDNCLYIISIDEGE